MSLDSKWSDDIVESDRLLKLQTPSLIRRQLVIPKVAIEPHKKICFTCTKVSTIRCIPTFNDDKCHDWNEKANPAYIEWQESLARANIKPDDHEPTLFDL